VTDTVTRRAVLDRFEHLASFELAPRELDEAAGAADPIVLEVPLAIPWNVAVVANGFGDTVTFDAGSLAPPTPEHVKFLLDHRTDKPFGYGVAFTDTGTGLAATVAIPRAELDDPDVARAVRQMGNGVRDAVSVGVAYGDTTEAKQADGTFAITVHAGRLVELSTVVVPRFDDARHQPLLAAHERGAMSTMTVSPVDPDPEPDDPPDDSAARLAAHTAALASYGGAVVRYEPHPLARFTSYIEYAEARTHDRNIPDLQAVWVDQVTVNNPGVMAPHWLSTIYGIVGLGRPFVTALGGPMSAGASGMQVNWPYYDGDLNTIVGIQAAEKTEITSVRVDIKSGTANLATYAGGSDVSYQLILRSSPSYIAAYESILAASYAMVTDNAAADAALAASGDYVIVDLLTALPQTIAAALFTASSKVQRATGAPATVVAAADDVYGAIAGAVFSIGSAPTGNVAGASASASGLTVELAGFRVVNVPSLPAGAALVTNRQAGVWVEDGPHTVTAESPAKLGRDVAIYGLGTWATFAPMGIVELTATVPVAATSRTAAKDKDK